MIPQYQRLSGNVDRPLIKVYSVKFSIFSVAVVLLPLASFIFCVLWSILFYFERSTATHCHVFNFLPSISAAIGNYQPQRIVWQSAIVLHEIPRFIIAFMYYDYYNSVIRKNRRNIAYLAMLLNAVELCALLTLSLWTSIDNYEIHKIAFSTFIISSEVYMVISYFLNLNCRREALTKTETKSIGYKRLLCVTNFLSFVLAIYFFMRHNQYCESGAYSMFALFEYMAVFTNMGFHMTAYWDFAGRNLCFDWKKGIYFSSISA